MTLKAFTFAEIRGQEKAKRAMEIAAAGGHHLALVGPRGCGKSSLVAAYSNYAASDPQAPKVMAPATTATPRELAGGGETGSDLVGHLEGGLLVLDDIDRFRLETLAAVRTCIDGGAVEPSIGSNAPRMFQLIATLSVCPCGYGDIGFSPCGEGRGCLVRHQWRTLRWLLDVLDLQVELDNTKPSDWIETRGGDELSIERIARARRQQQQRGVRNADLEGDFLRRMCSLERPAAELFDRAIYVQEMTGRDCAGALRVARTLADMESLTEIRRVHLAEALIYRFSRPLFSQYIKRNMGEGVLAGCHVATGSATRAPRKRQSSDGNKY